jgi:predicted double-glycine peptidase
MRRHPIALAASLLLLPALAGEPLLSVPFIRQEREGCGSAAAAMVMRYWLAQGARLNEDAADPDVIQKQLYRREAQGIYGSAMREYFEQNGFSAYVIDAGTADLEHHLRRGRPLIVCLQARDGPLHYVVVVGVDRDREEVVVHDPGRGSAIRQKASEFQKAWHARGNWTLLAVPKS